MEIINEKLTSEKFILEEQNNEIERKKQNSKAFFRQNVKDLKEKSKIEIEKKYFVKKKA